MGSTAVNLHESDEPPPATAEGLRRWRRSRMIALAAFVVVITLLIVADQRGWLLVPRGDDMATYHGIEVRVLRVIDGDTIEIDIPDTRQQRPATRVVLWGINCPEPAAAGRDAEPFAAEATELTRSLVQDQLARLRVEPQRTRDSFGRLLAHVETLGARSVNEALLEAGLARTDERRPHAMLLRYAQLEVNARRMQRGVWDERESDDD